MPGFLSSAMGDIFGGDTPQFPLTPYQVATRAAVIYLAGVAIVRLGKSRLISRATPLDVILGFNLGSLLSRGITGHASITDTLLASAVLVGVHWLMTAAACRSPSFERLLKGHVHALVEQGQPLPENMLRSHVSASDLSEAMRLQGVEQLQEVKAAYKELNGEVSVIKR